MTNGKYDVADYDIRNGMNYEAMTDFEINEAVAKARFEKLITRDPRMPWCSDPDYCNRIEFSWPIIVENKINIAADHFYDEDTNAVFWEEDWEAEGLAGGKWVRSTNKNPLRAAMIVYLMIKDGES